MNKIIKKCKFCKFIFYDDEQIKQDYSHKEFVTDGICECKKNNFLPVCFSEGTPGELIVKYDFCCINFEYNKFWKQKRFNEICECFQNTIKWKQGYKRDLINQNQK